MEQEEKDLAIFELSKMDNSLLNIIARRNESTRVDVIRKWIQAEARRMVQPLVDAHNAEAIPDSDELHSMLAYNVLEKAE